MAIKPIEILINAKDQASGVFDKLSNKLKLVGVAVAGYFGIRAFTGVVQGAADFEAALSKVQAATGAASGEMGQLKKAAEDAGSSTKYTAVEAAGALETLAKSGLSATDSIKALPAVLDLAQAGGIDLAQSSEYMTKAVMGLGLSFDDAGRVADVLAKGANASNTSVTGLAQALSYAAPVANSLGMSLEGTVAIIGKFADAGIDASRAGTALNSIMSQFLDPASKFRAELASAGITTNDFEKALHELAAAGPAGSKAINAVGQEAGPALRALLNQGMGSLDELKGKLNDAAGSAKETAAVMENNLNGAFKGLSSAWDTVSNALGTPVLPVLTSAVTQLANALRGAVSDGTMQKFGEAIAAAFQSGVTWARAFLATIDFNQLGTDLRAFADRTGEAFTKAGEYATNAGNIVQLAYGVMSAGTNTVMGSVYGIGAAFAGVVSNVQSGIALLYTAMAKVTFGEVSAAYQQAADSIKVSADATMAASQALEEKAKQAFLAVAAGANSAREGFNGLATGATAAGTAIAGATPALTAAATALAAQGVELVKLRNEYDALAKSGGLIAAGDKLKEVIAALKAGTPEAQTHATAIEKLRKEYDALIGAGNLQGARDKLKEISTALAVMVPSADAAAKAIDAVGKTMGPAAKAAEEHAAAVKKLREEYAAAVASGDWQAAAEAQVKLDAALSKSPAIAAAAAAELKGVGKAAADMGRDAAEAAQNLERAFDKLGVTSTASLQKTAKEFTAAYDTIKNSATSTAEDVTAAFGGMAQAVIDGNKGVAPSWLKAEGAARGYKVVVDETGKVSMKTNAEIEKSAQAHQKAAKAADDNRTALEKLNDEKEREISALEKANQLKEREEELYRKKLNVDKDGFTLDSNGQRMQQSVPTGNYVYETAKAQGLDEKAAVALMDKFFQNGKGVGTKQGTDWFSTVNKAIADMVMDAARKRVQNETPQKPIQPTQPTAPAQQMAAPVMSDPAPQQRPTTPQQPSPERSGGGITPHTYISNVTIPGVGSASLRFADADSQRQNETLLRQLVQAKGVAQ